MNQQNQQRRREEENLYSTPSMERKKSITRREQEDLDKLLKDMIEELESFPEYSSYGNNHNNNYNRNNIHNSRFQRNTSQTRSFSHSPSLRTQVPGIISYNSGTGQSSPLDPSSPGAINHHNLSQSHHPLQSRHFPTSKVSTTQAVVHHPQSSAPSTITSVTNSGRMRESSPFKSGSGVTSTGQPYKNLYGRRSGQEGEVEYTYGQVKPPPPLQLKYQPSGASFHHHSTPTTEYTLEGHHDEDDFIGYTKTTPCSGSGQSSLPVMPIGVPHKQHDVPSYSPAPSRSSAKSVTLTPTLKPVTLSSDPRSSSADRIRTISADRNPTNPTISADRNLTNPTISADRIRSTHVLPGAVIDLEDHDRSGVYASVLGKKSLSRSEREELDELVQVMMEEVRNFPDYIPTNGSTRRGTPFRRSTSHGSSNVLKSMPGNASNVSRLSRSRMESRSPSRSLNQGSSLNRFMDRSNSWNRGLLRDSTSPGRCSRVLDQGTHGHSHGHGPGGVQCGITNGGIVKPVEPLPPHLLTRPTQWREDEVAGGHRLQLDRTPYHARADSRPFTYGVTPATAYPVLQRRRQNTESTAYIVENNPRPEQFTTYRHGVGDGSSFKSSHFVSGPGLQSSSGGNYGNRTMDPNATYAIPRGTSYQQQQQSNYGNEPLYNEQLQTMHPKIAPNENEVFSEGSYAESSALDSSLCEGGGDDPFNSTNISWLQRQQNKLKVRRSSLDSHDKKVREEMFTELVGTVSGRKVPAINDSSRESSPPYQQSVTSPVRSPLMSPDRNRQIEDSGRQIDRTRTPSPPRSMVIRKDRNRSPVRGSKPDESPSTEEQIQLKSKVNYSSGPTIRSTPLQRQKSDSSFDRYASRPMVVVSKNDDNENNVPQRSPSIPLYATISRSGNEGISTGSTKPYDKYENRMNSFMSPPAANESNLVRHSSTGLLLRPGPPTTHEPPQPSSSPTRSPTTKSPPASSPLVTVSPTYDRPKSPLSPVLVRPGSKSPIRSRSPVRFKLDDSS